MFRPKHLVAALLLLVPVSGRAQPELNQKIVQICEAEMGQKVGDGECFALAAHALHQAGGTRRFKDNPGKGDYVWGKLIICLQGADSAPVEEGNLADILPGDIIQFRDVTFKKKGMTFTFGHHTAVIDQLSNHNTDIKILQENFGGKKIVTTMTLHARDLKKGWLRIYRPLTADEAKKH